MAKSKKPPARTKHPKKPPQSVKDVQILPNRKTKATGERGRKKPDSTEIPDGVKAILAEMMPLIQKGYPESTVVNSIGLDENVWEGYCSKYPALRLEIKRVQSHIYMKWQDDLSDGGQGWQAKAVLLERRNGSEWSRTAAGRPTNTASPYSSAMAKRKAKR